jgi:hypothetical protein
MSMYIYNALAIRLAESTSVSITTFQRRVLDLVPEHDTRLNTLTVIDILGCILVVRLEMVLPVATQRSLTTVSFCTIRRTAYCNGAYSY